MMTRLALLLGLTMAITPAAAAAQTDASPGPGVVDEALVMQLCAAVTADETELESCVGAVEAAVTHMLEDVPATEQSLLDQAQALVDDTVEGLREVDIEQALDDVIGSAQDFELDVDIDVQGAIDDVVSAVEDLELNIDVDIEAALDAAVAEALATTEDIDLQALVDDALAEAQTAIDDADLQGTVDDAVAALEDSVANTQAIVAEAQTWAQENQDAVCRGGSVSLGTTVGIAVFVVTGVEWLGLQAFWATERFTNAACGDFVEE